MKNKKQTILIILISVLIILGITAFVLATTINKTKANTGTGEEETNAQQTIQFNDKNLYNAIKRCFDENNIEYTSDDINTTLTMTQENINNIGGLGLQENDISDLTGLEKFTEIKALDLTNNKIIDIGVLSKLTNLETLKLNENEVTDIGSLSNLTNLTALGIKGNPINDISIISKFKKLQYLDLGNNNTTDKDIEAVANLKNLIYLCISETQITNINVLKDLTNLQGLEIQKNKIDDIAILENFPQLTHLAIHENDIKDITVLGELENLEELHIADNQISDISVLKKLSELKLLNMETNPISDISPIKDLALEKLYASYCNIEDITPINNMSSLQEYHINNQTINKTITSGREIALPQILIDAKNSSSKAYVGNGIDYQLTNCTISSDGKKVIVNNGATRATVTIRGTGGATGTVLQIDVASDTTKPILTVTYNPPQTQETTESVVVTIKSNEDIDTTKIPESWTVVDSKTIQRTYLENTQDEITIYDLAGNSNKITIEVTNIIKQCNHTGGYTTKWNETEHWKECNDCQEEIPNTRENHNITNYISNGDETHSGTCTVCKGKLTEACTYNGNTCTKCGATKPNTGCVHNYITQYNETEHWEYCTKCKTELEGSRKNHTFGTPTSNGNGTHTKKCTSCPYSKTEDCTYVNGKCSECGANKPDTECTHNYEIKYNEIEHWEECTKCGAEKSGSRQNHTYGTATGNGNGTHSRKCIVCPHIKTEKCNCSIGGLCSICGDKEYIEDCEHSYEIKYNETEHWEECTKCGAEKPESRVIHTGKIGDNGNGTHTEKCTGCSYSKTENCNYVNGKCSECGATKPDNENPGDGQDNTNNGQNNGNTNNGNSNNGNSNNGNSGGKPLPQTGTSSIVIIGIIAFTVLGALTFIRIKKYKLN